MPLDISKIDQIDCMLYDLNKPLTWMMQPPATSTKWSIPTPMGVGASAAIIQFNLVHCALAFSNESEMLGRAGDGMTLPAYLRNYVTHPGPWSMALAASAVQTGYASASGIASTHMDCKPQNFVISSCLGCSSCDNALAMLVNFFDRGCAMSGAISCLPIFHMPNNLSASAADAEADESY